MSPLRCVDRAVRLAASRGAASSGARPPSASAAWRCRRWSAATSSPHSRRTTRVRWVSPRSTIDVLDDYRLQRGPEAGLLRRHPDDAGAQVRSKPLPAPRPSIPARADVAYPSPGVYSAHDRAGLPAGIRLPDGRLATCLTSPSRSARLASVADLEGKTVALGSANRQGILQPGSGPGRNNDHGPG